MFFKEEEKKKTIIILHTWQTTAIQITTNLKNKNKGQNSISTSINIENWLHYNQTGQPVFLSTKCVFCFKFLKNHAFTDSDQHRIHLFTCV